MAEKIIRSICYFAERLHDGVLGALRDRVRMLSDMGYAVQTQRLCCPGHNMLDLEKAVADDSLFLSVGRVDEDAAAPLMRDFFLARNVAFHVDLTSHPIERRFVDLFFEIAEKRPEHTFRFAYVFNNPPSSPFFPSAQYAQDGFSIGFQPTDLSHNCDGLEDWLQRMRAAWEEVAGLFARDPLFLGIDSSVAPLFRGSSSLVNFVGRLGYDFDRSTTSDLYVKISEFVASRNPEKVGLCGIMFPCLEDFELADEYQRGGFSIERNIYLSLHSGLGIDTYPIGVDEDPERVVEILQTLQALSRKYSKPLSARFVSDGRARVGEKTSFDNPYLKDVVVRPL